MLKQTIYFFSILFILASCSKEKSSMTVNLTDAPGDYLEVNVDIQSVEIHYADSDSDTSDTSASQAGWTVLEVEPQIFNLIELQDSITSITTDDGLDPGKITQIRLILGSENTVMLADSSVFDLTVPSGSTSGLKLNINETLEEGEELEILLDFDADQSINVTGNGKYMLRPVIKQVK